MNKVILMGRLTKEPEVRYSAGNQSQMAICRYTLAVDRDFKRDGEPTADFINCVAFGKAGEFAGNYFHKGMMVAVVGSIRNGSYEKEGVKHYTTDIIVSEQHFAESKSSFESRNNNQGYNQPAYSAPSNNAQPQNNYSQDFAGAGQGYNPAPAANSQNDGFAPIEGAIEEDDSLPF